MNRLAAALLIAAVLASPAYAVCTATWTGAAANGNWNDAANWSPTGVPDAADDVCVTGAGTYTLSAPAGALSFQSLTVGAASGTQSVALTGAQLTVSTLNTNASGAITLAGSSLNATSAVNLGGPVSVDAASTLTLAGQVVIAATATLSSAGSVHLDGVTANSGAINTSGAIDVSNLLLNKTGASFVSSGAFTSTESASFSGALDLNGTSTLRGTWNSGTTSIGSNGTATIAAPSLTMNYRTMRVSGRVNVAGDVSSYGGAIDMVSAGVLVALGTATISCDITGAGTIDVPAGNSPSFNSKVFKASELRAAGTPTITWASLSVATYNLQGGTITFWYSADLTQSLVTGSGSIAASSIFLGRVTPGGTGKVGLITFRAAVNFRSPVDFEFASNESYDAIVVEGSLYAMRSWPLNLSMLGGYVPAMGTRFDVVRFKDAGTLSLKVTPDFAVTLAAAKLTLTRTSLLTTRSDFDGDGNNDIVLRHNYTGGNTLWKMDGTAFAALVNLPGIETNYQLIGTGDFNGDGQADILLRQDSGRLVAWLMNNGSIIGYQEFPRPADPQDRVVATGDFDLNGYTDLLIRGYYRHTIVLNHGAGIEFNRPLPSFDAFPVVACGDFNGDRRLDLLLRNPSTGANAIWLLYGAEFDSVIDLPALSDPSYQISAAADMDGDGDTDIIWRNSATGANAIWVMNNTTLEKIVDLPTVTDTRITIVGPR